MKRSDVEDTSYRVETLTVVSGFRKAWTVSRRGLTLKQAEAWRRIEERTHGPDGARVRHESDY